MSSEDLERIRELAESGRLHTWDIRRASDGHMSAVETDVSPDVLALLAEVARLERERDAAKHQRDNFERIARERAENAHVNWQARGAAEAALAVAREREQRAVKAIEKALAANRTPYSVKQWLRAGLVDEPAAAGRVGPGRDGDSSGADVGASAASEGRGEGNEPPTRANSSAAPVLAGSSRVEDGGVGNEPRAGAAAATLAEEGGRASNRAADAPSLAGWSSVGGASTEPSDCAPSSASAAADEPGEDAGMSAEQSLLPLGAKLRVWAAVQPPQGDFGKELLAAAEEFDRIVDTLKEWRDLGDVSSGGFGGTLIERTDIILRRELGE